MIVGTNLGPVDSRQRAAPVHSSTSPTASARDRLGILPQSRREPRCGIASHPEQHRIVGHELVSADGDAGAIPRRELECRRGGPSIDHGIQLSAPDRRDNARRVSRRQAGERLIGIDAHRENAERGVVAWNRQRKAAVAGVAVPQFEAGVRIDAGEADDPARGGDGVPVMDGFR